MFEEIELGGEFFGRLMAIDAEITAKVASELTIHPFSSSSAARNAAIAS